LLTGMQSIKDLRLADVAAIGSTVSPFRLASASVLLAAAEPLFQKLIGWSTAKVVKRAASLA